MKLRRCHEEKEKRQGGGHYHFQKPGGVSAHLLQVPVPQLAGIKKELRCQNISFASDKDTILIAAVVTTKSSFYSNSSFILRR